MLLKIKELRKEKKLSQEQLAAKIPISVRTFAKWESESDEISVQNLQKIADILNVHIFELFNNILPYNSDEIEIPGLSEENSIYEVQKETIKILKNEVDFLQNIIIKNLESMKAS